MFLLIETRVINTDHIIRVDLFAKGRACVQLFLAESHDRGDDLFWPRESEVGKALQWWFAEANRASYRPGPIHDLTVDVLNAYRQSMLASYRPPASDADAEPDPAEWPCVLANPDPTANRRNFL